MCIRDRNYDIVINLDGGGITGQASAARLGIACLLYTSVKSLDEAIPYWENVLGLKCYAIE